MEGEWKPRNGGTENNAHKRRGLFREHESCNLPSRLKLERHRQEMATTKTAFAHFSIAKVACFTDSDVAGLVKDTGIVEQSQSLRNHPKRRRIPEHKEQHGSFQAYLDSLEKSKNYALVVKELTKRFKHMDAVGSLFLYTVGEEIEPGQAALSVKVKTCEPELTLS